MAFQPPNLGENWPEMSATNDLQKQWQRELDNFHAEIGRLTTEVEIWKAQAIKNGDEVERLRETLGYGSWEAQARAHHADAERLRRHLRLAAHDLEQAGHTGEARLARLEAER